MKKILFAILALILAACSAQPPQVTVASPIPTSFDLDTIVDYLATEQRNPDALPVLGVEMPTEAEGGTIGKLSHIALDKIGFVPVQDADEGNNFYVKGNTYYLSPLPEMSSEDGTTLLLLSESTGTQFVYESKDGTDVRYMPKSVKCKGECVLAVSFNEKEPGVTQIFDIDPETGKILGIAQAYYTSVDDVVKFEKFDSSKWRTVVSGADAIVLGMTDGAEGMTYDVESKDFIIQADTKLHSLDQSEFHYVDGFGFYADSDEEGVFLADGASGWLEAKEYVSPSGSTRYDVGLKSFVEMDGVMVWVDSYSEENGNLTVVIDDTSYTWEAKNGDWLEAESKAMQQATASIDQYGVDPETITIVEDGDLVKVTDNETGKVLIESDGKTARFEMGFAADTIAKNSCEPTEFKPNHNGLLPGTEANPSGFAKYTTSLSNDSGLPRWAGMKQQYFLIDRERQCWGKFQQTKTEENKDKVIVYRDAEGVAQVVYLLDEITWDEIYAFAGDR